VVLVILIAGVHLPPALWPAVELLVEGLLIALGATVVVRHARGRWHLHRHAHHGTTHLHLHSHAHGASHGHTHPRLDTRRALGFGLLHGLAGSAAILALLVAAAPTRAMQLAYFLAFGLGTLAGMLFVTVTLMGVVRLASGRGTHWATAVHLGSAYASVAVGLLVAGRTLLRF